MINEWLMYRIWVSKETQPYVVEKIVKNVPKFPFSFNRYYDLPNERGSCTV